MISNIKNINNYRGNFRKYDFLTGVLANEFIAHKN